MANQRYNQTSNKKTWRYGWRTYEKNGWRNDEKKCMMKGSKPDFLERKDGNKNESDETAKNKQRFKNDG